MNFIQKVLKTEESRGESEERKQTYEGEREKGVRLIERGNRKEIEGSWVKERK